MKNHLTINIPLKVLWKILLPGVVVVCIIGVIGGIVIVDRMVMPQIVGVNRDIVEVPDVVGLDYEKAREKLFSIGLFTETKSKEYDNLAEVQSIISQYPEKGEKVKKGRKIAVVVSKGKEIAIIPDVRNLSERQARILLKKHGFQVGNVKKSYSGEKPIDMVIDAFPKSGTTISRDMEVDIYISKGPRPTHAEAPNLVGESIGSAKKKIEEFGLTVGKIDYQNNPSLLPGTVISQSVAPGSKVPLESKVNLIVSVIR